LAHPGMGQTREALLATGGSLRLGLATRRLQPDQLCEGGDSCALVASHDQKIVYATMLNGLCQ